MVLEKWFRKLGFFFQVGEKWFCKLRFFFWSDFSRTTFLEKWLQIKWLIAYETVSSINDVGIFRHGGYESQLTNKKNRSNLEADREILMRSPINE